MLCTLALAGLTALYPVVIQQGFDRFSKGDPNLVWLLPLVIVGVTCAKALAQYGQAVAVQSIVLRVIEALQGDLFRALTRADLAAVVRDAPARHATRFTVDAAAIREALTKSINGVADVLTVIGLVGSMVWLDWQMSLIAAAMYPIAVVPILRLGKRIRRASGGMQERMGETAAQLTESFAAARVVRAYRLEGQEEARAERAFARLRESLFAIARTRASLDPTLEALGGLAVAAVLGFVGWRVASGQGTIGEFTGFVAALLIAARPVRSLGSLNAALQEGLAGLSRVFAVMDVPRQMHGRAGGGAAAGRARPGRVRRCRLPLRRHAGCGAGGLELHRRAGTDRGAGRALGRREVHRAGAGPAAVRRDRGRGAAGRGRCAGGLAGVACATPSPMSARTR